MFSDQTNEANEVTVDLGSRKATVTLSDGEKIREAFMTYAVKHKTQFTDLGLQEDPGKVRIDSAHSLRIGTWLLEGYDGRLLLSKRAAGSSRGSTFYRVLILLEHSANGRWVVVGVESERVLPRQ